MQRPLIAVLLVLMFDPGAALAQAPTTRAGAIEEARAEKVAALRPEEVSSAERLLRQIKDQKLLERISAGYNGWRLKLGNMVTGGGFAAGPEYSREDLLEGNLLVRGGAQGSTRGYYKMDAEAHLPHLLDDRLQVDLLGTHRNYGGLPYYGPGPESLKIERTNYRLEDTAIDAIAAVRPAPYVKLGGSAGMLWVNVGPGTDSRYASTEQVFPAAGVAGLAQQTNFTRTGVFGEIDYLDDELGPKFGGNYRFRYDWYRDREARGYGFRRMDVELQQYIPFFNRTRRIVLRAQGTFTESDAGETTPFYLQPVLGGSNDLRGYRPFRFSGPNRILYNAEYQWEIFSGLDGAIFFDAGKVMQRRTLLAFADLETNAGFGLRFNVRNATFIRLDTGFSQEGFQVWFTFNDLFTREANRYTSQALR